MIIFLAFTYFALLIWVGNPYFHSFTVTGVPLSVLPNLRQIPRPSKGKLRNPWIGHDYLPEHLYVFKCHREADAGQVRTIYFVGVPFGSWDSTNLVILFLDLPQLLYQCAVALTGRHITLSLLSRQGLVWYGIVHTTQKNLGQETPENKLFCVTSYFLVVTLCLVYKDLKRYFSLPSFMSA